jgi:hypothetical protein
MERSPCAPGSKRPVKAARPRVAEMPKQSAAAAM